MKNYRQDDCQRFIDTALLLEKTEKRMQDIYETMLSLHTKETAAVFFNNQGKAFHYNYVEYRDRAEDFALRLALREKGLLETLNSLEKSYIPLWLDESLPRGLLDLHHRAFSPLRDLLP